MTLDVARTYISNNIRKHVRVYTYHHHNSIHNKQEPTTALPVFTAVGHVTLSVQSLSHVTGVPDALSPGAVFLWARDSAAVNAYEAVCLFTYWGFSS